MGKEREERVQAPRTSSALPGNLSKDPQETEYASPVP